MNRLALVLACCAGVAFAQAPSATVTGFPTKDRSLTIERCVKTSFSYAGCTVVFPQQARASLTAACADPTTKYPNVVCAHLARLQLRGVGGPVERKSALETLNRLCTAKDRVACADLGLLTGWSNAAEGKKYLAIACEEEPQKSPVGLCAKLRASLQPTAKRRTFTVTSSTFKEVKKGTRCNLGVALDGAEGCFVNVTCGERELYDGEAPCPNADSGAEKMTSGEDLDPAVSFDAAKSAIELREEASATDAAWLVTGKLSR